MLFLYGFLITLGLVLLGVGFLFLRYRKFANNFELQNNLMEELAFTQGNISFSDEDLAAKFEHVTVLYTLIINNDIFKVFDISKYESNNLIAITEHIDKKIEQMLCEEELGKERLQKMMDGVFITDCSVINLKDGRWMWRINRGKSEYYGY